MTAGRSPYLKGREATRGGSCCLLDGCAGGGAGVNGGRRRFRAEKHRKLGAGQAVVRSTAPARSKPTRLSAPVFPLARASVLVGSGYTRLVPVARPAVPVTRGHGSRFTRIRFRLPGFRFTVPVTARAGSRCTLHS